MGKRKSAKQAPKRNKYVLPTEFDCKFCDHKQCVDVRLQRSKHVGSAKCRVCKKSFETGINHLHERADVYCAWMDAIEEQNNEEKSEDNKSGTNKDDDYEQQEQNQEDYSSSNEERPRMKKIQKNKDNVQNLQKRKRKVESSSEEENSLDDMINE